MLVALATLAACDEKLSDLTGPTPNLEPTFSSIRSSIIDASDPSGRLACIQCHTDAGRSPAGGLNLRREVAYTSLVGVASTGKPGAVRVVPGDPERSYLIHKLEGRADIVGLRMPRNNGPFLSEGQIAVIKRWIALGAANN